MKSSLSGLDTAARLNDLPSDEVACRNTPAFCDDDATAVSAGGFQHKSNYTVCIPDGDSFVVGGLHVFLWTCDMERQYSSSI